MVLFKDTSGLKVISVGLLLGMVSCLHGMPVDRLSLSVQGDKVYLVYSGEIAELDPLALPLFDNNGMFVIDNPENLKDNTSLALDVTLAERCLGNIWSMGWEIPLFSEVSAGSLVKKRHHPNPVPILFFVDARVIVGGTGIYRYGKLPLGHSHSHGSAHATRAGPVCA